MSKTNKTELTQEQIAKFVAAQKKNTGNGVSEVARQVVAEGIKSFNETGVLPTRKQQIEEILKRVPKATAHSAAAARHKARVHFNLVESKAKA